MQKVHLKSPKNWINDPNGFIYYKGKYHLFYQHFPYAPIWGRMHWGHAVSDDLFTWEHLDIALYPSKTDDRSGCFSGSAVEHDNKMYLYYTGINYLEEDCENINCTINDNFISAQLMITSDDGYHFDNLCNKKTVISPISDPRVGSVADTRDPKVWRGSDAWYMILGSTVNEKGRFLFFKSEDLETWSYVNHFEKESMGRMWECPDYFEIDGQGVAVFSPMGILNDEKDYDSATVCTIAKFDEKTCTMTMSDDCRFFDYGIDLYAPQSTLDENGNRVIIAWARMPEAVEGKWSGMMCIPRLVQINDNHIYFRPHPNVKNKFTKKITSPSHRGGYLLKTTLSKGEKINIGGYIIKYEDGKIITDRSAVYVSGTTRREYFESPVINEECELDIFVDTNLIEVYIANGKYVITNVVYGISDEIIGDNYLLYKAEDD